MPERDAALGHPLLSRPDWARGANIVFGLACVALLAASALLAMRVSTPGRWGDSPNNLDTARNIWLGRGFVSNMVLQLVTPQPVPVPETLRSPGLPFMFAALFWLTGGVHYGAILLLNVLLVMLGALALWAAVALEGGRWMAGLLGALFVVSHHLYFVVPTVNNAALVLCTSLALVLIAANERGRLRGARLAALCGTVVAIGFLMKQTFVLSGIPFTIALLMTDTTVRLRRRTMHAALGIATFGLLTSPYWIHNLVQYGTPLFVSYGNFRLPLHYGLMSYQTMVHHVMFNEPPVTYGDVARQIGVGRMLRVDVGYLRTIALLVAKLNPVVVLIAAVGAAVWDARARRRALVVLTLAIAPVAEAYAFLPEPRYLWPLWPLLLYLTWLAVRGVVLRYPALPVVRVSAPRLRLLGFASIGTAFVFAFVLAVPVWRLDFEQANDRPPKYASMVKDLPPDAVVYGGHPWFMGWWLDRTVVLYPQGGRRALERVDAQYHPGYLLDVSRFKIGGDFAADELEKIDGGTDWTLYRIVRPTLDRP